MDDLVLVASDPYLLKKFADIVRWHLEQAGVDIADEKTQLWATRDIEPDEGGALPHQQHLQRRWGLDDCRL